MAVRYFAEHENMTDIMNDPLAKQRVDDMLDSTIGKERCRLLASLAFETMRQLMHFQEEKQDFGGALTTMLRLMLLDGLHQRPAVDDAFAANVASSVIADILRSLYLAPMLREKGTRAADGMRALDATDPTVMERLAEAYLTYALAGARFTTEGMPPSVTAAASRLMPEFFRKAADLVQKELARDA